MQLHPALFGSMLAQAPKPKAAIFSFQAVKGKEAASF